jgi:hypothetical protein
MGCPICDNKPTNCDCTATEREQFDEIESLKAEIARLREERRWVSVGERLPEDEEWVEIAGTWGENIGYFDGEQWLDSQSETFDYLVTHWRKRTPGPEGDGNG